MPSILGANTLSSGYDVDNSLRFNDDDSAYMHKDQSAGDRNKATFSAWIKRGNLGSNQAFFGIYGAASDAGQIEIRFQGSGDGLHCTGQASNWRRTNRAFGDISAWYHIVVAFDTTQGTAGNRVKVYVNGVQETSFAAAEDPDENEDLAWGLNNAKVVIGSNYNANSPGDYFDGYMAEVVLIDGQQLDPTSFGEFDEDSPQIWKPINVSGLTFGTNGFYLDFKDSSNLGNDANGGTDLTEVNLAAVDQTTDTCTNNFATMNPLDNFYQGATFSEGNCRVVTGSSPVTWNTSTFGLNSGKWYMEATIIDGGSGGSTLIGIADRVTVAAAQELGGLATTYAYLSSGNFRTGDSNTSNSVSATDGDIIGVALDLDSGQNTISYYKNNTLIVAAQNITAPVSGNYFIASGVWLDNDTGTTDHNFGNPVVAHSSAASDANGYGSFEYAPPNGYYAICTKNIAQYG